MKVKKFSKDLPNLLITEKGDFIDLYVDKIRICKNNPQSISQAFKEVKTFNTNLFFKGDIIVISYGVAIELPYFHEAQIRPRSSIFKNTGLLLTNSPSTIDESYKGNNDEWFGVFYATRDGEINRFDRLTQFKIEKKMVVPNIEYVKHLENKNRGGYGTSGK
jgi:dUTP pyrophosphatase